MDGHAVAAAVPLENATAEGRLRERARTLQLLQGLGEILVRERGLEEIVQAVTDTGCELSGAAFGAFFYNVVNEQGESYMLYTISGVAREAFSSFPMPRKTAIFAPTFDGDGIVRIDDVLADPRYGKNSPYFGMPEGHLPVRSYLAAPVLSPTGQVLGGLFFGHPSPGLFGDLAEGVIKTLASQAAVAIDNARMHTILLQKLSDSVHLAAIVASSDDAIIGKNTNGIITSWNESATQMFGYSPDEAIGKSILMLIPPELQSQEDEILSKIRSGVKIDHFETIRRRKDGSNIEISLSVSPIHDTTGRVVGAAKIVRDITARKSYERQLKQAALELSKAKEELEDRVAERTVALTEAISQMEELSYTVSHDLRSPLRAMRIYGEALIEDYGHLLQAEPEAVRYLSRISDNAYRLDRMITDILAYGRIARNELKFDRVNLNLLVQEIVQNYEEFRDTDPEIDVGELGEVVGHEPSLTQIVSNLLGNAAKFVKPGTRPKIKVWTERVGDNVCLSVQDNGIGIPPEYHKRLFKMFERINPRAEYDGTGVGLAIVRKAAERMGGSCGVDSDGENGCRFWVQLPAVIQ